MTTLICEELADNRPTRGADWRRLVTLLPRLLWRAQQRRRDRMTLLTMSDPMLRDIGISRQQANRTAQEISLWR